MIIFGYLVEIWLFMEKLSNTVFDSILVTDNNGKFEVDGCIIVLYKFVLGMYRVYSSVDLTAPSTHFGHSVDSEHRLVQFTHN